MASGLNRSNFEENMMLSLPAVLQMHGSTPMDNESFALLNTQNYMDKYREIENILADEKKTNEEFKKFYKALKTDHTRLKTECVDLKSQMNNLIEDNKMMQEKYKAMFEKMQQESRRKQLIIEELKQRELDEVKLEGLREEIAHELEAPYKDIVRQLELELQKIQQELVKTKSDNQTLRNALERGKEENDVFTEQIKLKHQVELSAIKKDRDVLRQRMQETNHSEISRIKELIRENNQLKVKVSALSEENDELREKLAHAESNNNALTRNHSKFMSDYSTKISVLESEKEALKNKSENALKETFILNEQLAENQRKLHALERENNSIKLRFDEVQHNCKRDMANLKLEMAKEKGEFNKIKEELRNEMQELKTKNDVLASSVDLHKKLLDEKERELAKAVNVANDEHWNKISELTNEKIELESKMQLMHKDYEIKLNSIQLEKDKSDDMLKAFEKQREEILRENSKLRSLMNDSESLRADLEREQEKSRDLYKKCSKLESELTSNNSLEAEMTEINMKLKNELLFTSHEVQKLKDQINKIKEGYENQLAEVKASHIAEKNQYVFKCEDLQSKLVNQNAKLNEAKKYMTKKKKQYQQYAKAIQTKAASLNLKYNELKLKEQNMKHMVPLEQYNKLKAHLNSITKRHEIFRNVLLNDPNSPASVPGIGSINNPNFALLASVHGNNLAALNLESDNLLKSSNFVNQSSFIVPEMTKSQMSQMNAEFEEITNRIDKLAMAQNDNLKLSERSAVKVHSPVKSLNQSKDSEQQQQHQQQQHPQYDAKVINNQAKQSPQIKEKQIEVRRLSFSSTSSSSTSSLDSDKEHNKLNQSGHKEQDHQELDGHESYDENEFEKSYSNHSSSSSL